MMMATIRSYELWCDGDLAAGELGCVVGNVYTSFTGFYCKSGAGSVQLALTGRHLEKEGRAFWDLGMGMDYKYKMGAADVPREVFLSRFHAARSSSSGGRGGGSGGDDGGGGGDGGRGAVVGVDMIEGKT